MCVGRGIADAGVCREAVSEDLEGKGLGYGVGNEDMSRRGGWG